MIRYSFIALLVVLFLFSVDAAKLKSKCGDPAARNCIVEGECGDGRGGRFGLRRGPCIPGRAAFAQSDKCLKLGCEYCACFPKECRPIKAFVRLCSSVKVKLPVGGKGKKSNKKPKED